MTVSERNVSDALAYLADDPHPIAKARHAMTLCENACKRIYAERFIAATGPVEQRRALAEVSEEYQAAKEAEADAMLDFERHKSRVKAAEMLLEVWRTENANARAAERIR